MRRLNAKGRRGFFPVLAGASAGPAIGARPAGAYNINNQSVFSVVFRAQQYFDASGACKTCQDAH